MVSSLLTIIIPCENSLPGIKITIENLLKQTKIKGTRVFVLDLGSKDGSFQYVSQASSEFLRTLKIELLQIKNIKEPEFYKSIQSTYVLWLSPGSVFSSPDFIFNSLNDLGKNKEFYAYISETKKPFINILGGYYLQKGKLSLCCVFCKRNLLDKIGYKKESERFNIILDRSIIKKKYKILKGKIKFINETTKINFYI